jgi:predicted nucleic acid-binding protein
VAWKRIVNASPIIHLTHLGLVHLLNEPDVIVLVPEAVLNELACLGSDDPAVTAVRSTPWIQVVPTPAIPDFLRAWKLGAGETAVLTLALEETGPDKEVVLDDWKARRRAEGLGIPVRGTLACLLIAKNLGRIDAVRPLLEKLHQSGMYLSDELMERVIKMAGEI